MQAVTWRLAFLSAIVGCAAIWTEAVINDRNTVQAAAEAKLAATARLLELHADRALEAGGRVVDAMVAAIGNPEELRNAGQGAPMQQRLQALVASSPQISSAWVLDARGNPLVENWAFPARATISFASRPYFQAHLHGNNSLYIGGLAIGPNLGRPRFTLSRALQDDAGTFAGVAAAGINAEYFASVYAEAGLGPASRFAMFRSDGEPLAVWPPPDGNSPQEIGTLPVPLPSRGSGDILRHQDHRLTVIRHLAGFPVALIVSQPRQDVMAEWRRRTWHSGAVMFVVFIALSGFAIFGLRGARREAALVETLQFERALLEQRVRERTAALAESEQRLRQAMHAGDLGLLWYDRVGQRFGWSPEVAEMLGLGQENDGASAADWSHLLHPEDLVPVMEVANSQGACLQFRIIRADGEGQRWLEWRPAVATLETHETPARLEGVVADITQRKDEEQRHRLLTRELHHRAKNALAVVQATMHLTPADDVATYIQAVSGRVAALARAHTLLAEGVWKGTELQALVEGEMAPFLASGEGGTSVVLHGPATTLPAIATQPLAMAIHELATNATKHGALSQPGGQVHLSWWPEDEGRSLHLRWQESGGPPVPPGGPRRRGFGSRVLQATVRGQLGGELCFEWRSEGLVCDIVLPRGRASAANGMAGQKIAPAEAMSGLSPR